MEKSVKITGIIAGAALIVALLAYSLIAGLSPTNKVNVNGMATVEAQPDLVKVYYSVETTGDTASEAKDANAEIVDDLITALVKEGFEREDIVTQNFNVYEDYEWKDTGRVFKGYKATHSIFVEMSTENTDKIGDAIDAGVDSGATLNYINFELSRELQNEYKAEALRLATQDARIKAEAIADGLNKNLGRVVSTSDSSFDYSPWRVYSYEGSLAAGGNIAEDAKLATTNIQPGDKEITARVSVVYKLG